MWFVEKFGPKDPNIFKYGPRKKKIAHPNKVSTGQYMYSKARKWTEFYFIRRNMS